jgi:dolichol-phosphate mannosyltransferase
MRDHASIGIIIPLYNEEKNFPELRNRLTKVMETLDNPLHILFIDDGSTDSIKQLLRNWTTEDSRIGHIIFSRNFGHQIAISAGIDHCPGDAVIVMDGDLQDPPELISSFIETWKQGADVVYATREKRKENIFKRFCYWLFYRILKKVSNINIPLDSGDFCLMDRKVIDIIRRMPERNRFIRGMRSWIGFRQASITYERDRRFAGESKYSLGKLTLLAMDGFVNFSSAPLRIVMIIGVIIALLSLLGIIIYLVAYITSSDIPKGFTTTILVNLLSSAIELIAIGVLGEYLGRIYEEVKKRPKYIIDEFISQFGSKRDIEPVNSRRE